MTTQIDSPRRSTRTVVEIVDPDDVGEYLEHAYGARLRLSQIAAIPHDGGTPLLTHTRFDAGEFVLDEIELAGVVRVSPDPLNKVAAVSARRGRISSTCAGLRGQAGAGQVAMLAQPDLPYEATTHDVAFTTVLLDPALVASVATATPESQVRLPIRFSVFEPVDEAAQRLWQGTVDYVRNTVLTEGSLTTPLVLGHTCRLLAAVTLSAFPGTVALAQTAHDRNDAKPALLRRAVEFIDSNAANDIALGDIATAIHVSPRAVQYLFRRHLDTTPLQYLRRTRLHLAHQDLLVGSRVNDTVTAVAARWGFAHTGRFAVMYREAYGQSPHATLRGG